MFVGDGRTRMEMSQKGREVVRISDQKRGMEWILFPADKNYLERGAPRRGRRGARRRTLRGDRSLRRRAGPDLSAGRRSRTSTDAPR